MKQIKPFTRLIVLVIVVLVVVAAIVYFGRPKPAVPVWPDVQGLNNDSKFVIGKALKVSGDKLDFLQISEITINGRPSTNYQSRVVTIDDQTKFFDLVTKKPLRMTIKDIVLGSPLRVVSRDNVANRLDITADQIVIMSKP